MANVFDFFQVMEVLFKAKTSHAMTFSYQLCAILLLLSMVRDTNSMYATCPTAKHITSLLEAKGNSDNNQGLICDCTSDPSPSTIGWDINCMRKFDGAPPLPTVDVNSANDTRVGDGNAYISNSPTGSDYFIEPSPLGFSIKYIHGKLIEINCDESAPDFKPAMFQGKSCVHYTE